MARSAAGTARWVASSSRGETSPQPGRRRRRPGPPVPSGLHAGQDQRQPRPHRHHPPQLPRRRRQPNRRHHRRPHPQPLTEPITGDALREEFGEWRPAGGVFTPTVTGDALRDKSREWGPAWQLLTGPVTGDAFREKSRGIIVVDEEGDGGDGPESSARAAPSTTSATAISTPPVAPAKPAGAQRAERGRRHQHRAAPHRVGQTAGGHLQRRRRDPVQRQSDTDLPHRQAAPAEQQHEHRHGHAGGEPSQGGERHVPAPDPGDAGVAHCRWPGPSPVTSSVTRTPRGSAQRL